MMIRLKWFRVQVVGNDHGCLEGNLILLCEFTLLCWLNNDVICNPQEGNEWGSFSYGLWYSFLSLSGVSVLVTPIGDCLETRLINFHFKLQATCE